MKTYYIKLNIIQNLRQKSLNFGLHRHKYKGIFMRTPQTVKALEELGRVQLSKSFFMREFLYCEISQIENLSNIAENPELAIASGKNLCEKVLEPIQQQLGRISIRSAYRSQEVSAKGAENKNQYIKPAIEEPKE